MSDIDQRTDAQACKQADEPQDLTRPPTKIIVCSACRDEAGSDGHPRPGRLFGDKVRNIAEQDGLIVEQVECLGNCKRRLSAVLVKPDGWTYVFGGLSTDDAADLVKGAQLYRDAENGLIPWRGRPDCLKRGLVARIPPQSFNGKST